MKSMYCDGLRLPVAPPHCRGDRSSSHAGPHAGAVLRQSGAARPRCLAAAPEILRSDGLSGQHSDRRAGCGVASAVAIAALLQPATPHQRSASGWHARRIAGWHRSPWPRPKPGYQGCRPDRADTRPAPAKLSGGGRGLQPRLKAERQRAADHSSPGSSVGSGLDLVRPSSCFHLSRGAQAAGRTRCTKGCPFRTRNSDLPPALAE